MVDASKFVPDFRRATSPLPAMLQCLWYRRVETCLFWGANHGVDLLNVRGLKELEHQGPVVMVT